MDWKRLFKAIGIVCLFIVFFSGIAYGFVYLVENHLTYIFGYIFGFALIVAFVWMVYEVLSPPSGTKK